MTTGGHREGVQQRGATDTIERRWDEDTQKLLDRYPYRDMQILVYIMNEHEMSGYEDVAVFTRKERSHQIEDKTDTQSDAQRRVVTMQLPQGYLYWGIDFYVINENSWDHLAPEFIERDARMAASYGLHELAARIRRRIR